MINMTQKPKPQTLKGFRDFLPKEAALREWMVGVFTATFKKFGFEPLGSPTLEYADTLVGNLGQEEKLIQTFKDLGGRRVGLRYDQTIPTARILAQYPEIAMPFKRYQIQSAFRFEKPQKGRYREFLQCDIDIFGVNQMTAEMEIMQIINDVIPKFGFKDFKVRINNRKLLNELVETAGIPTNQFNAAMQALDNLDKTSKETVLKLMVQKGLNQKAALKFLDLASGFNQKRLTEKTEGQKELKILFELIELAGLNPGKFVFDPLLTRGLDYYTGPVFEVVVAEKRIGVIAGGGRYNQLVNQLGGPDIAATGIAFGFEPIYELIKNQKFTSNKKQTTAVLVTVFSPQLLKDSIKFTNTLRIKGQLNAELYPDPKAKLDKQLKYADRKKIPYVVILGPDEVEKKQAVLKNMTDGKQTSLTLSQILRKLTS